MQRGVTGTPTFFIGNRQAGLIGYDQFKAYVDSALVDAGRAAPAGAPLGDSAAARPVPVDSGGR